MLLISAKELLGQEVSVQSVLDEVLKKFAAHFVQVLVFSHFKQFVGQDWQKLLASGY